jgi:hypothetical protein
MSNRRGLSIDASYQVSVHLAKREGKTEKSQTPAGKISIGLQLGGASLETRNLSLGCLEIFPSCPLTGVKIHTIIAGGTK